METGIRGVGYEDWDMKTGIQGVGYEDWDMKTGIRGVRYGDYYFIIFISVSTSLITALDQCQHHINQYQTIRVS